MSLINTKDSLNFFSLHSIFYQIVKSIIDTTLVDNQFYLGVVTELSGGILITETNLLNVIVYLVNNLTSKILSVD